MKKIIAFSFLVWAIAAVSDPRPAQALAAIPVVEGVDMEEVTEVVATGRIVAGVFPVCGNPGDPDYQEFNFMQLMTIPGVGRVWAYTDFVYTPGLKMSTFQMSCQDGEDTIVIYGLDTCNC